MLRAGCKVSALNRTGFKTRRLGLARFTIFDQAEDLMTLKGIIIQL